MLIIFLVSHCYKCNSCFKRQCQCVHLTCFSVDIHVCMYVVVTFRSYAKGEDEDDVSPFLSLPLPPFFSFSMFDWHQTFVLAIGVKRTYSSVYITLYLD